MSNSSDANWAIWALFSSTARNSSYFTGDANANNIYNAALAAAQNAPNSDFAGLVLYVPNATGQTLNGQPWGGTPQEYIGYVAVPDAGEISLIGSLGMLMLAGFASRKRLGLHCVVGNAR
ncbi:MAG: hypothetical protein JOY93_10120 [Acidobacteriales bacterium]|nr:hypothetical protein [Terriglobales bacterium]